MVTWKVSRCTRCTPNMSRAFMCSEQLLHVSLLAALNVVQRRPSTQHTPMIFFKIVPMCSCVSAFHAQLPVEKNTSSCVWKADIHKHYYPDLRPTFLCTKAISDSREKPRDHSTWKTWNFGIGTPSFLLMDFQSYTFTPSWDQGAAVAI